MGMRDVTHAMAHRASTAVVTSIMPTEENIDLAKHADSLANQNADAYAPRTSMDTNKNASVTELTDGRHVFEIPSENDLDSTQSGTSDDS